jgi:outer membrane protein
MAPRVRIPPSRWGRRSIGAAIPLCVALFAFPPHRAAAETIEAALASAYQNNPQLNARRAIVRQSDEGVAQALSGYRPSISANASVGDQYTSEKEIFPPIPGTSLSQSAAVQIKGHTRPASYGATASHPQRFAGYRRSTANASSPAIDHEFVLDGLLDRELRWLCGSEGP